MNIMYKMRYVLFVISVILLSACNRHSEMEETLTETEAIMDEHPDSALALLDGIEAGDLRSEKLRAYFALLKSQAMDKNFIDVKDDSLISIARNYYSDSNDRYHRMLSQYYYGRVKFNAEDYSQSILAYLLALDLGRELNDYFWQGMAAREIAVIYNTNYNLNEELKYTEISLEAFKKSGKQPYLNYAILDLASAYSNTGRYEKGLKIAKGVKNLALKTNDNYLLADVQRLFGKAFFSIKQYGKAEKHYIDLLRSGLATNEDTILLGLCYIHNNKEPEARQILKNIKDTSYIAYSMLESEVAYSQNAPEKAFSALRKYHEKSNTILRNSINKNLHGSVINYYDMSAHANKAEADRLQLTIWLIIISALFLAIITFLFINHLLHRQREKIEQNVCMAEQLMETLFAKEKECSCAQDSIRVLLSSQYDMFDNLCRLIYESSTKDIARKRISDTVDAFIKQFSSNNKKIKELENFIDEHHSNLISDFKSDLPMLKDAEYRLFLLSVLGFSCTTISMFCKDDKISSVYDRKRHLKDKIKKLDTEKCSRYLSYL